VRQVLQRRPGGMYDIGFCASCRLTLKSSPRYEFGLDKSEFGQSAALAEDSAGPVHRGVAGFRARAQVPAFLCHQPLKAMANTRRRLAATVWPITCRSFPLWPANGLLFLNLGRVFELEFFKTF